MRVLAVTSGSKGGTGKSTLLLNVAVTHAYWFRDSYTYPAVFIDLNLDVGSATILLLGSPTAWRDTRSLVDFLQGRLGDPISAFYVKKWATEDGEIRLVFTPSRPTGSSVYLSQTAFRQVLGALERALHPLAVYVDLPPISPGHPLEAVFGNVDYVLPVATPDYSSLEAVSHFVAYLKDRYGVPMAKPVLNMFSIDRDVEPVTGEKWASLASKVLGEDPHVVPYDELFLVARAAMEIEVLKLSPEESPGVKALIRYADYLKILF